MKSLHGIIFPPVPQPYFDWYLTLPPTWGVLDLRSEFQESAIEQIIADYYRPFSLTDSDEKTIRQALENLVTDLNHSKALLALILPSVSSQQKISTCVITVRWSSATPNKTGLESIKETLHHKGLPYEQHLSPMRHRYILYTYHVDQSIQNHAVMPLFDAGWILTVSSMTDDEELSRILKDLITQIIESAEFYRDERKPPW